MPVIPYTYIIKPNNAEYTIIECPSEFYRSWNAKYVRVHVIDLIAGVNTDAYGVQFINTEYLKPEHIAVHATFNQESDDTNHFICMANEHFTPPKSFKIYTSQIFFKLWFVDIIDNQLVKINDNVKAIVQLEFVF